jgi:hypothetical protein
MRRVIFSLGLLCLLTAPMGALAWSDNPDTPEGWAWTEIRAGRVADFNKHCGTTLDPRKSTGWEDPCRQISPGFLVDVLTVQKWQVQVPLRGVRLRGAHIVGAIELTNAEITSELWIDASRISGRMSLANAHLKRLLSLDGSVIGGDMDASRMNAETLVTWSEHASFEGDVDLRGATVGGEFSMISASFSKKLDADDMDVQGTLFMRDHASFGGDVNLRDATVGGNLDMNGASFSKALDADRLKVHGTLFMRDHATFGGDVNLRAATIGGDVDMNSATFSKAMDADGMDVHGSVFMRDHATFGGDVTLMTAKIGSNLDMETAALSEKLIADRVEVHGYLFLRKASIGGDVNLISAQIGSSLEMDAATFSKELVAERMDVHGYLFMRDHASFGGDVDLISTKIGADLDMGTATFSKRLLGDGLEVHGGLRMNNHASFAGDVSIIGATVGQLTLDSAVASSIDLSDISGATGSELILTGVNWRCRVIPEDTKNVEPQKKDTRTHQTRWPLGSASDQAEQCEGTEESLPKLILRNAHIESLQDDRESWPPRIDLEGMRYDRLGGSQVAGNADTPPRSSEEWVDWLGRNRAFSQQPYNQLAAVLSAAGQRATSESVLFAGRERERDLLRSSPKEGLWRWLTHEFSSWAWLGILRGVAGYGIGLYTFRVLWWVAGLTIIGAVVLRFSPYARERSVVWRLGASLHRLLPVVQLNKEFEDFFDNVPEPGKPLKFHPWQMAFFSGVALAGWVLGFFLLAAMGGLIQK